jgi:hypothetical protein
MRHTYPLGLLLLALAGTAAAQADNCETIRAGIDARIKASGVSDHKLTIVDAHAITAAKVVGSCDLGTKKILYTRPSAPGAAASAAAPPLATPTRAVKRMPAEPMLTECKDGSVAADGDCSKTKKKATP